MYCISTIASSSVVLECSTGEACINDVLQYNCTINGDLKNWIVTEFQQSGEQISVNKFGNVLPSSDPDYIVTFTGYTCHHHCYWLLLYNQIKLKLCVTIRLIKCR